MIEVQEHLLISMLRYALGRHTYVVDDTAKAVEDNWSRLSSTVQNLVISTLEEYLSGVDDDTSWSMDRKRWENLLNFCKENKTR